MILKKPYAFLIKYFKVIHLLLSSLMVLIIFFYKNLIGFFQNYINKDYIISLSNSYALTYTSIWLYIVLLIILILSISLIILLKHKNKPILYYIILFAYYFILLVFFIYINKVLLTFEYQLLEPTDTRIIRDVLLILFAPQIYFVAISFIRAIGFNLKKFDFVNDLKELNLVNEDNEEFEFNVNFDNETAFRKVRKFFREIKYYFFENKILILIFLGIGLIITLYFVFTRKKENYDLYYSQNKVFYYSNLEYSINDAIITNLDYQGNILDDYYMVINVNIKNKSGKYQKVDYNSIKLINGKNVYTSNTNYYKHFIDVNPKEFPSSLSNKADINTLLVFSLNKKISSNYKLRLFNGTVTVRNQKINKNIYIKLKYQKMINDIEENRYNSNDTIVFDETYFKNTSINISNCIITNSYKYNYSICKKNNCEDYVDILFPNSGGVNMLICQTQFNIDSSAYYFNKYKTLNYFISDYLFIKNIKEDKMLKINNITPENATNFIAVELSEEINSINDLALLFNIRNKSYKIFLK